MIDLKRQGLKNIALKVRYVLENVIVEQGEVYLIDEFKQKKGSFSIALDGIVDGDSFIDYEKKIANFDHHTITQAPSTCRQVFVAVADVSQEIQFYKQFMMDGNQKIDIFMNHVDEDSILATYILLNPMAALNDTKNGGLLQALIMAEDEIDRTAGAHCTAEISMMKNIAWIFEPYHIAKYSKQMFSMNESQKRRLMKEVFERIDAYLAGHAKQITLKGSYKILMKGKNVHLLVDEGPWSRYMAAKNGITRAISIVRQNPNHYVLWSTKDDGFIDEARSRLNKNETIQRDRRRAALGETWEEISQRNKWGGPKFLGSPRKDGSIYYATELFYIVDELKGSLIKKVKNYFLR